MKIEFMIPWRNYMPGGIFDFPGGMATELIRRGVVKKVDGEEPKPKLKLPRFRKSNTGKVVRV